jgi:hypothetical protein
MKTLKYSPSRRKSVHNLDGDEGIHKIYEAGTGDRINHALEKKRKISKLNIRVNKVVKEPTDYSDNRLNIYMTVYIREQSKSIAY